MNKETRRSADILRKVLQTKHCMDYKTFVKVMHDRKKDHYTKSSFREMQSDFTRWYCNLDFHHACKFMDYVLEREKKNG